MQKLSISLLAVAILSGCTDAPGTTTASDQLAATGNIATNYCGYTTPAYATDMMRAINNARAVGRSCGGTYFNPVPAVAYNCALTQAAQVHTADMVTYNFFLHTGSNGLAVSNRVANANYSASYVAENLALGYDNAYSTVNGWLNSPGHCANIMSANAREFGVSYSSGWVQGSQHVWTTVFASPY